MSYLRLAAKRSLLQHVVHAPRAAAFSVSVRRTAGKEDALHEDAQGRSDEVEHHKQDQLQKQKEGKGHWKDELASNSESIIKADRGEVEASDETIKKLQDESAKAASKK